MTASACPGNPPFSVPPGTSLKTLFRDASRILDAADIRLLLEFSTGISRVRLMSHPEYSLTDKEAEAVSNAFSRRIKGEPAAYITGEKEFYGLAFKVTPDVLIPRPDTELLTELAIQKLPQGGRLLDVGTGSGAIAVSVASIRKDARVFASDISEKALLIAKENALRNNVNILFFNGKWFDSLDKDSRFDMIVSNPPYIPSGDPHLSCGGLEYEPEIALTDFGDGLSAYGILTDRARYFLKAGGFLFVEHGYDQAEDVRRKFYKNGFKDIQSWQDLAGIERVTGGRFEGLIE